MAGCIDANDQHPGPSHCGHCAVIFELDAILVGCCCSGRSLAALAWLESATWLLEADGMPQGWVLMCSQACIFWNDLDKTIHTKILEFRGIAGN